MLGATSVNHGIYVQEEPEWVQNITKMDGTATLTIEEIVNAYDWVRDIVLLLLLLLLFLVRYKFFQAMIHSSHL